MITELSWISWIIPIFEYLSLSTGSRGETWITRTISGTCIHHFKLHLLWYCLYQRGLHLFKDVYGVEMRNFALQGGSGRDGLDGLPGKPGMKVIQTCAHSLTCIINLLLLLICPYELHWALGIWSMSLITMCFTIPAGWPGTKRRARSGECTNVFFVTL